MTPQLWTRNLEWDEWKLMHPDLNDYDAEYLYNAELKMFQNYQQEVINQTVNRQNRLVGDLLNVSADISSILTGGKGTNKPPRRYILFSGLYPSNVVGEAVGRALDDVRVYLRKGDEFIYNFIIEGSNSVLFDGTHSGTYRVLANHDFLGTTATIGLNVLQAANAYNIANRLPGGLGDDAGQIELISRSTSF